MCHTMIMILNIKEDMVWLLGQTIGIIMLNDTHPRYYSIASSPLQPEGYKKIQIIFTVIGKYTKWMSNLSINSNIIYFYLNQLLLFRRNQNVVSYQLVLG